MVDVSIRNLVKNYGDWSAVRGVDIEIADKEFLVLVGPSGCGKSTTLRMVAGLEEITSGEIRIGGDRVNKLPPWQRDIAMVFQSYALYPHMTVFENMAFGLKLRKLHAHEIKVRVDKAAGILELGNLLTRKPRELSGGQRQRVAMGRALVRNPQVFLFDEPLSNLDAQLRLQMRTEIKRMHQAVRTTTIYVTHDQAEAMTLADRIVVMNKGLIEQVGTPHEIYHNPATKFVAGFIGSPAMNFFPAELRGGAGALELVLSGLDPITLPQERRERYSEFVGKPMTFGLRPEHLAASSEENSNKPGVAHFDVSVDLIETMGMETLVYSDVRGVQLVARVAPTSGAVQGNRLRVAADLNHMHLIEPDLGRVV